MDIEDNITAVLVSYLNLFEYKLFYFVLISHLFCIVDEALFITHDQHNEMPNILWWVKIYFTFVESLVESFELNFFISTWCDVLWCCWYVRPFISIKSFIFYYYIIISSHITMNLLSNYKYTLKHFKWDIKIKLCTKF